MKELNIVWLLLKTSLLNNKQLAQAPGREYEGAEIIKILTTHPLHWFRPVFQLFLTFKSKLAEQDSQLGLKNNF